MKNMKLAWNPHDTAKWKRGTANDVAKHHPPNGAAKWHYQMTWPFQMRFRATITQLSTNASTIGPYTCHFISTASQSPKAMT